MRFTQCHRGFTPQNQAGRGRQRALVGLHFARQSHGHARNFARLPLEECGEDGRIVTLLHGCHAGGCSGVRVVAHNDRGGADKSSITRLGCVGETALQSGTQVRHHRHGQVRRENIALNHAPRLRPRRCVRHRGAGGDDVQRAAHHIGEQQRHKARRGHRLRQPPPFDE